MKQTSAILAYTILVSSLIGLVPIVQGQLSAHPNYDPCLSEPIIGLLGVTTAGQIETCIEYPASVKAGTTFVPSLWLTAPPIAGAGTPTFVVTWSTYGGCTASGTTNTGAGSTGFGTQYSSVVSVTMTGQQCSLEARVVYKNGAATIILDHPFEMVILTTDVPFSTIISGTLDTQTRFCAASSLGAACSTPTTNNVVSGTLTVTNAGGQTITVSGTLDNLNRICAASTFGSTCNIATVNTVVSGTLTLSGTLDNLNRFCAASTLGSACSTPTVNAVVSGTLDVLDRLCGASATGTACNQATLSAVLSGTVALSGTVNTVVSGTLDTLNRLCGASAVGTTCNQLTINAVISGTLDTLSRLCAASGLTTTCNTPVVLQCSTAALTADPKACTENSTTGNTNVTNIVTLPQPLRVQAVCSSSALATDPAACGTPVLTSGQNLMLSGFVIGLLYFLAIMCSRFKEPAVNFFGAGLAAIAGFRAFDSAGGWLGGAMVIIATFTLCAWCSISGGIRILNGTPLFERVGRKKSITDL